MGSVGVINLLNLRVVQIFVGDSFLIEPIQSLDATYHSWPFIAMCNIDNERFQVIIQMPFERFSDFRTECSKIIILVRP